jgi:hypothetical protein
VQRLNGGPQPTGKEVPLKWPSQKSKLIWVEFRPPPSAVVPTAARFPSIYIQEDDLNEDELHMYTTDQVSRSGGNFDELDYWRLEQSRYPHLSRMARRFLMICASSTLTNTFMPILAVPSWVLTWI